MKVAAFVSTPRAAMAGALALWLLAGPALPAAQPPGGLDAAQALQDLLVEAIARAENSVVAVARVRKANVGDAEGAGDLSQLFRRGPAPTDPDFVPHDFGAGVVIDAPGLVLTTAHVVGDPQQSDYYVWSKQRPFSASLVASDPWYDLAVLKVADAEFTPIALGDAGSLKKGHIVLALGNPYAIARDGEVSASWGIVSNLLRRAPRTPARSRDPLGRETLHHYGTLIQTDAKLNLGYSGGALLNLQGEMIGLTVSYTAAAGYEQAAGFAIPVNDTFRRAVAALKAGRKPAYGFLGVGPETLDEELRRQGRHGARVGSVYAGTPAARVDLRTGDLITHVNGRPVYDDDDLIRLIGGLAPEMTAALTVARGDLAAGDVKLLERSAVLSKKHLRTVQPPFGTAEEDSWRGMQVDYWTAAPDFELAGPRLDPAGCVYVADVRRDSPAWNAGLRTGAFVTHVGRQRVSKPQAFYRLAAESGGAVTLRVITSRGDAAERTVSP